MLLNTEVSPLKFKNLLSTTKRIVKHHNDLMVAKGEHFNLFSVLNIETKENKTHSAFLAELLNPKGSHLMGDVFLKLFLMTVKHNERLEAEASRIFFSENASVKVEHGIGTINLRKKENENPSEATGGRIDIYLKAKNGNLISIENKIHALDQEAQIQRYCNYRKDRNTVYYLTLKGEEPSNFSKLKLKSGTDFFNISYEKEIIVWLEQCLKEVPNFTSLREAINQYILLIKKLTHILNIEEQKELEKTIVNHLEESRYIAENYQNLVNNIREEFRVDLKKRLSIDSRLKMFELKSELKIEQAYSKLWIHFKNRKDIPFSYGVEPFSAKGNGNGAMFVGLYGHEYAKCEGITAPLKLNDVWQHIQWLTTTKDDNRVHLNSPYLLKVLYNRESNEYEKLVSTILEQIVSFIEETNVFIFKEYNKVVTN